MPIVCCTTAKRVRYSSVRGETTTLSLLRSIVDRYLLTSSGDEAAVLFASWAIDEGAACRGARRARRFGRTRSGL